ncbi:hypothetical protein [Bradyrhizobium sp. 173]|uniref:hypothetical protein n=1 Tax=Bradyrhizobium sp. 173 TaxID=2782644 RepID=UPI001FFB5E3A|nr:hypothetical protein [Bradyrhizobium sp. 173]
MMKLQSHELMAMKLVEYISESSAGSTAFVGRNYLGNWVVLEQSGIFGGLFASRGQALKYARRKNGQHPEAILQVSREIELVIPHHSGEARLGGRPPQQTATSLCEHADRQEDDH